jgi:hypothetical protein
MISNYERMISRNGGVSALSSHSLPQMLVIARAGFVFVFEKAIMVPGAHMGSQERHQFWSVAVVAISKQNEQ